MVSKKQKRLSPIHPGEVLQDLLKESGLTVNAQALAPPRACESDRWHREGREGYYSGYCDAVGSVFRHLRPDVGNPSSEVRTCGS